MDELYRDQILEHYKRPHHFGRLDDYDLDFEDTNPFCGDEQHVFIKLDDDGRVSEVSFEGQGCAISTAATSLLTDELIGMTREELLRLPKETVLELLGIEISATRMKCAMLGLKVIKSASLGEPADWEDEGEEGDPASVAVELRQHPSLYRCRRSLLDPLQLVGEPALLHRRHQRRDRLLPDERHAGVGDQQDPCDDQHGGEGAQRSSHRPSIA